jgi:LPXTG-site transpeptidase (sortase) family protein
MDVTGSIETKRARAGLRRALLLALGVAAVVALAAACGGNSKASQPGTPTASAPTVAPTPGPNAGLKTPIALSPGDELTQADLAARGAGTPGRGDFLGERLVIPSIGVDAPLSAKVVGSDGQMPNPNGPEDVAYYDFSDWPNMGGTPGKGGNVVLAGHVDYIHYGPAVFWRLHEIAVGDIVTIKMNDGTEANYKIEFNKRITVGGADWTGIVAATADESITLITCGGQFEAGHYDSRQIVWGRRV